MKIHKLRFKNLNSLVGEWSIDFTHPSYHAQGIFAITGPTGAGKSTILDAICLALYGQTPRLNSISKNNNEIMSRQTGECFAELEFSTASGCYRSFWEQSRARKKPGGNLQLITRELADLKNKQILETKQVAVTAKITELTGMDFEHFTRAMLLAQGGFAKFLHATPDERSPILEQITGSQIYSEISKKAHEHRTAHDKKLEVITTQLATLQLLTEAEVSALESELAALASQQIQVTSNRNAYLEQLRWLDEIANIKADIELVMAGQAKLALEKEAFKIQDEQLTNGQKAQELNAKIYLQLNSLRKHQKQLASSLEQQQQQLPELDQQHALARHSLAQQQQTLTEYKVYAFNHLTLIQQVRELDTRLESVSNLLGKLGSARDNLSQQIADVNALVNTKQHELKAIKAQFNHAEKYALDSAMDKELISTLSGINHSLDNLAQLIADNTRLDEQLWAAQENLTKLASEEVEVTQQLHQLATTIHTQQAALKQLIETQVAISNNYSLAELTRQRVSLAGQQQQLSELRQLLAGYQDNLAQLSINSSSQAEKQHELNLLTPQLAICETRIDDMGQLLTSLNRQLILENKIQSLQNEREKLEDNQPCPLCGSLEHPYVASKPLPISAIEKQITITKKTEHQLHHQRSILTKAIASLEAGVTELSKQSHSLNDMLAEQHRKVTQQAKTLDLAEVTDLAGLAIAINQAENTLAVEVNRIDGAITQLVTLTKQIDSLNKQIKNQEQAHMLLLTRQTRLTTSLASVKDKLANLSNSQNQVAQRITEQQQELGIQLQNYGISLQMTSIADIKLQLQTRRNNWDQQQQQISQLQEQASQLSQSIEKLHVQLAGLHQQLTHTNAELITQQELYSSLQAQRYALFGDKNTQREDQALRIKQEQLEQAVHQLQQEYHSCKQQLNTAHKLIENYQDQLKPVAQELHNLEDEFKDAMAKFGFGDEAEFSKALLPAEYLAELFQQREAQHTQGIELTAEFTRLNTKLITEQNKQLTTASQDQLNQNLEELNAALEANNQTIGSIRTKLQTNQQACNQQIAIIDEIAQQQLNAQRWQQLHALIGSADGKKFRNFAQGLTFELVVRNANSQLQTMSDRYLLVRDQEAPLELNVIDNYQGGEIRTTKNLSGGESFVISLALALGLSKLSSSKVQVDSLFLDEGFGSLDEDSLQTALDALAGLQQEGKLIGVISHVGALKDRISLQIQVEPLTGGVSRISGCGCAKLS